MRRRVKTYFANYHVEQSRSAEDDLLPSWLVGSGLVDEPNVATTQSSTDGTDVHEVVQLLHRLSQTSVCSKFPQSFQYLPERSFSTLTSQEPDIARI